MRAVSIKSIGELIQRQSPHLDLASSNRALRLFSEQWLHVVKQDMQVGHVLPPFPIQEGVLYHSDGLKTSCVQHITMSLSDRIPLPQIRNAWEVTMKKLDILRQVGMFFGPSFAHDGLCILELSFISADNLFMILMILGSEF